MSKTTKKSGTSKTTRETTLVARKFWTQRVEPGEPKILGKHLPKGLLVIHNDGPGGVHVKTGYSNVDGVLPAGDTQIIPVHNEIALAVLDFQQATLEFEFKPMPK